MLYSKSNIDVLLIENQVVALKMYLSLIVKTILRANGYSQDY